MVKWTETFHMETDFSYLSMFEWTWTKTGKKRHISYFYIYYILTDIYTLEEMVMLQFRYIRHVRQAQVTFRLTCISLVCVHSSSFFMLPAVKLCQTSVGQNDAPVEFKSLEFVFGKSETFEIQFRVKHGCRQSTVNQFCFSKTVWLPLK